MSKSNFSPSAPKYGPGDNVTSKFDTNMPKAVYFVIKALWTGSWYEYEIMEYQGSTTITATEDTLDPLTPTGMSGTVSAANFTLTPGVQGISANMWTWTDGDTDNNPPKAPEKPYFSCTCGAHITYGPDSMFHSDWCDTYSFYERQKQKDSTNES